MHESKIIKTSYRLQKNQYASNRPHAITAIQTTMEITAETFEITGSCFSACKCISGG